MQRASRDGLRRHDERRVPVCTAGRRLGCTKPSDGDQLRLDHATNNEADVKEPRRRSAGDTMV